LVPNRLNSDTCGDHGVGKELLRERHRQLGIGIAELGQLLDERMGGIQLKLGLQDGVALFLGKVRTLQ